MFYERLDAICSRKGMTVSALVKSLGLSTSKVTAWKNGTVPKGETLVKIADYLDLPLDYILGRTDTITEVNSHNTISGNNNIIGNGNSIGETLSEHEAALIDIFKKLNVVKQAQLIAYAAELEKED